MSLSVSNTFVSLTSSRFENEVMGHGYPHCGKRGREGAIWKIRDSVVLQKKIANVADVCNLSARKRLKFERCRNIPPFGEPDFVAFRKSGNRTRGFTDGERVARSFICFRQD